jgi:hypothetical protein
MNDIPRVPERLNDRLADSMCCASNNSGSLVIAT